MKIINDITLVDKPFSEMLTEGNYWHRTFHYHNISHYHNLKEGFILDLNKIPLERVATSAKSYIVIRSNPDDNVLTLKALGEILTHIVTRLDLQEDLIWTTEDDSTMKNHQLDITLDIPMMAELKTTER